MPSISRAPRSRSLRTRILVLFLVLGAVPVLFVGWITNARNLRAVDRFVEDEARSLSERTAREIAERLETQYGALLFLASNSATRAFLGDGAPGDGPDAGAPDEVRAYLQDVLERVDGRFAWVEIRDAADRVALRGGAPPTASPVVATPGRAAVPAALGGPAPLEVREPVEGLGEVRALQRVSAVFPGDFDQRSVGEEGRLAVVDTATGRFVHHPDRRRVDREAPEPWVTATRAGAARGPGVSDSSAIAVAAAIPGSTWAVVATASPAEFSGPFRAAATTNILLIGLVTLAAALGFYVSLNRTTGSLVQLTHGAERVAAGDLTPDLPPDSGDEVGTLTRAFHTMLARLREMLDDLRRSRQLAAVGRFSSQIAHEIRTPLTSIRMNLQGVLRTLEEPEDPEHRRWSLEIALREAERLERVAAGVLTLGRIGTGERSRIDLGALARDVVAAHERRRQEGGPSVGLHLPDVAPEIEGDRDALTSALHNVVENAVRAAGPTGSVTVRLTADAETAYLHVVDDGPGIEPDIRDRIFDPFFTTDRRGHGIGLSLASRAAEAHGGDLTLASGAPHEGAHFVFTLPLGGSR